MKDAVGTFLNCEVGRGAMQLGDTQHQIAADWLAVYESRGLTPAQ